MDTSETAQPVIKVKHVNYRKLAFQHYPSVCAYCGFGNKEPRRKQRGIGKAMSDYNITPQAAGNLPEEIKDVLEVAHIDCNRANNKISNLVILCPTCHRMHDLDLISTPTIIHMRNRPKIVRWSKLMKDAGRKAAETRRRRRSAEKRKRHNAAIKAAQTRAKNKSK